MVGKIKRIRQKLHHGAVRLEKADGSQNWVPNPTEMKINTPVSDAKVFNFPSGVFAGMKISPESLVQTLKVDEASNVTVNKHPHHHHHPHHHQQQQVITTGSGERKQQSKKLKLKERRERWLNKISAIKLEREQQTAQKRRKATPVVGDMRPLADALPELSQLIPALKTPARVQRKNKVLVKIKPEPTDYSQMNPAQKRKLLDEETSRFSEAVRNPVFKTNPLDVIGEHLRKRLRQEDEES